MLLYCGYSVNGSRRFLMRRLPQRTATLYCIKWGSVLETCTGIGMTGFAAGMKDSVAGIPRGWE